MPSVLEILTLDWFLPKALIGWSIGFILRIVEHLAYYKREGTLERFGQYVLWILVAGTQSVSISIPLSYVLLAILAFNLQSPTFILNCAYLLPIAISFIAIDLRQMLRQYKG